MTHYYADAGGFLRVIIYDVAVRTDIVRYLPSHVPQLMHS